MIFGNIFDLEVCPSEGLNCQHVALSIRNFTSILLIYPTNHKTLFIRKNDVRIGRYNRINDQFF